MRNAAPSTDPIKDYLAAIGRTPLLTAEEEVELATRIEAGLFARERLDAGTDLTARDRADLEWIARDGAEARDRMVRANLRLVVSVAKRYAGRGLPLTDLVQEGTLGLIRAVEKFDHRRGLKFSTYAVWWIKQSLSRGLADQGRTIRLPSHVADLVNRMSRVRRDLLAELDREPTTAELAAALDVTPEKVERLWRQSLDPVSLHVRVGEEDAVEFGDLLEDTGAPDPAETVASSLLRSELDRALTTLTEREAGVISLRYGLTCPEPKTLDEIGREFGVTRERIRQIESRGMSKLRAPAGRAALAGLL